MKPKLFRKLSRWRVTNIAIAVILVAGLAGVFAAPRAEVEANDGICEADAPDLTVCKNTTLNDDLFIAEGARCDSCDTCQMVLDYSGVNTSTPGNYPYTVTCTSVECEDVATGTVTVKGCMLVNIIECPGCTDCAEPPRMVAPSSIFGVKAEIINDTGSSHRVDATISITGNAEIAGTEGDTENTIDLMLMNHGERNVAGWSLHCTEPGEVEITVTTDEMSEPNLPEEWDECTVHQEADPSLSLTIDCPCEICTNCTPQDEFSVTVNATNNGDHNISNVTVTLASLDSYAHLKLGTPKNITLIAPGATESVTWIAVCDAVGPAEFGANAWGYDECTGDPVYAPTTNDYAAYCCTYQEDVIVDILCVRGLQSTVNPEYGLDHEPKYLPACDDGCLSRDKVVTGACDIDRTVDEMYDIVSTEQLFEVTAYVMNCTQGPKDLWAKIIEPEGSALADEPVHLFCPRTQIGSWVSPNGHSQVFLDNVCDCCGVEITWILECTDSTLDGDCDFDCNQIVVYADTVEGGEQWSNEPCNPACIIQETKAHLSAEMAAVVDDCDPCDPEAVNTVAVGQEYDVEICIWNGMPTTSWVNGEAAVKDVEIDLMISGPTTCAGTYTDLQIGDIPGDCDDGISGNEDNKVCVWLSDLIQCTPECLAEGVVSVSITDLRGTDENTCEPVKDDNIVTPCPLGINQCDIEVEIINPEYCEDYCWGDAFPVKARITNCGTCDFGEIDDMYADALVYLSWEGPGDVKLTTGAEPNPNPQELDAILHDPCPDECGEYEVIWMVKCMKPGDVTFHVCVETAPEWGGPEDTDKHLQIVDITEPPATVHQHLPPDVTVEIISPENLDTFVATSQEFTVTAEIRNDTKFVCHGDGVEVLEFPVTITDVDLLLHPDSATVVDDPFTQPFEIAAGGSELLTWTLHCDESGMMMADVAVTAETFDVCHEIERFSFPILLWQYPAAHLDVDITSVTPGTTINVCENFNVNYTVTNTGEADATEVEAILSVIPEGSARPAEGMESGYTMDIGTLEGHGQNGEYTGSWELHCKEACESTINITAEGFDEYGWHKKQECQSTGNFIIEDGCALMSYTGGGGIDGYPDGYIDMVGSGENGVMVAVLVGEASGLIGPFNLNVPISFNGDEMGNMVAMGAVLPDMDYASFHDHVHFITECICSDCPSLLDLLERFDLEGVNKDVMIFIGQLAMEPRYMDSPVPEGCYCASGGLLQVINGHFSGVGVALEYSYSVDLEGVMSFLDGEYCSTMAQEALREIPDKFIEDDSVTVRQLPAATDLGVTKIIPSTVTEYEVGETVVYKVTVQNHGPSLAPSAMVRDLLPPGLNYDSCDASQGWYDVTSGIWDVGDIDDGDSAWLEIDATVSTVGTITNQAVIIVTQGHDPVTTNNMAEIDITGTPAPPAEEALIPLAEGYNLISLPLIPYDPDIEDILEDLLLVDKVEKVAKYERETDDWYGYNPDAPSNTLDKMEDGWGYWMDMTSGGDLEFGGWELVKETDPPSLPPSYDVFDGWNLIGFKSTVPKLAANYLSGIAGKYVMIYGYDNGTFFIAGAPGHEYLEPGLGYWVAVVLELGETKGTIYP